MCRWLSPPRVHGCRPLPQLPQQGHLSLAKVFPERALAECPGDPSQRGLCPLCEAWGGHIPQLSFFSSCR